MAVRRGAGWYHSHTAPHLVSEPRALLLCPPRLVRAGRQSPAEVRLLQREPRAVQLDAANQRRRHVARVGGCAEPRVFKNARERRSLDVSGARCGCYACARSVHARRQHGHRERHLHW